MKLLDTFSGEGFVCRAYQYSNGRVEFVADADIDADGANGQHGEKPAYTIRDDGSEYLANGGMGLRRGKVIGVEDWFRHIVITGDDGQPRVFENGVIASMTSLRFTSKAKDDPAAYVDSETVPYIVLPPTVRERCKGIALGCRARATHIRTGKTVDCVVADIGPRRKCGELSIAAARAIGIPSSPRNGGTEKPVVRYELWPGEIAEINGMKYPMLKLG